jgi:hypothetical protein
VRKSFQSVGGQTPASGLTSAVSAQALAAGAAIALYAGWNARSLWGAWLHSPYDRSDPTAFLIWLLPIVIVWMRHFSRRIPPTLATGIAPFAIALAVSFAGVAVDLRSLEYLSLAVALSGFIPFRPATLLWLPLAASWMPGTGWAFSSHGPLYVNCARIVIGCGSLAITPLLLPRNEPVL